jgi:hypothetical protein
MKHSPASPRSPRRRHPRGYVSYVLVLSMGLVVTLMMLYAYRDALQQQSITAGVQLRVDYRDREESVLRALVNIVPNRAIRAMQGGSNLSSTTTTPLKWQTIFSDALDQADARSAVPLDMVSQLSLTGSMDANGADSTLTNIAGMFTAISPEATDVSCGVNRALGTGFPVPLNTDGDTAALDPVYPIISNTKVYGDLAAGQVGLSVADYPNFNLIPYPNISFGYGRPGQNFVAKRNWWAFSMCLGANDAATTGLPVVKRDFVLSIYEVPAQLAISTAAFAQFGQYSSGADWANVRVNGNVFAGRAQVQGSASFDGLSSRRGVTVTSANAIGGQSFTSSPFTPGTREDYLRTTAGADAFFPVSMPSESGRAAFIPINPGIAFFDRFSNASESNAVSTTTWNNYCSGALQCAMFLDVIQVASATDQTPTKLRFSYMKAGVRTTANLTDFNSHQWQTDRYPFNLIIVGSRHCIVVYPHRFHDYLAGLGADVMVNNSLCVNVDYPSDGTIHKPSFPCLDAETGVVIEECGDLSAFTKGFSLVTNMRLYFGDNFNTVTIAPPRGSGIPAPFYPPISIFAPEKRYGTDIAPVNVTLTGQVGNMASDTATTPIGILDSKNGIGTAVDPTQITANLSPITHPGALPPIMMMNWLVVLSERRREFW